MAMLATLPGSMPSNPNLPYPRTLSLHSLADEGAGRHVAASTAVNDGLRQEMGHERGGWVSPP